MSKPAPDIEALAARRAEIEARPETDAGAGGGAA